VIVGGGTAGWMAAAALRVATQREQCGIVVVESDDIGTVGVGESTLRASGSSIVTWNRRERFRSQYARSFKLAIQFVDWKRIGHIYFNPLVDWGSVRSREPRPNAVAAVPVLVNWPPADAIQI